ncbi:hypothetical protein QJS66_15940 [Kocuria rhizophila]|nr:hypothetical protein QJS66_15940 [Kocuria rhizophila]
MDRATGGAGQAPPHPDASLPPTEPAAAPARAGRSPEALYLGRQRRPPAGEQLRLL